MRDRKSLIERRITQPVPAYHVNRVWDHDTAEMTALDADEAKRERKARRHELLEAVIASLFVVVLVAFLCFIILVVVPWLTR